MMARPTIRSSLIWGALVAALYVTVALVSNGSGLQPVRPVFDGLAPPQPYRWVNPPRAFASDNQPPTDRMLVTPLSEVENQPLTVATDDGQAIVTFQEGSIPPKDGETSVDVVVTALDPASLGEPPKRFELEGNAYKFEATYSQSHEQVTPSKPVTIVIRFPADATKMLKNDAGVWTKVASDYAGASRQLFAVTSDVGTFAAAVDKSATAPPTPTPKKELPSWVYVVVALGLAVGVAFIMRRRKAKPAPPKGGARSNGDGPKPKPKKR